VTPLDKIARVLEGMLIDAAAGRVNTAATSEQIMLAILAPSESMLRDSCDKHDPADGGCVIQQRANRRWRAMVLVAIGEGHS
jgi:hypothetical protein